MNRLSVVDEIFLRSHRGMGTPIVLQGLWRTAEPVDRALLGHVHERLRTGPLGRRVVRPRVPGARPRWQPTTAAHPLTGTPEPISAAALLDWADRQGENLDPEAGPGWRLATADLDDGGCVVSLTCSHALADGRALALAVDHALGGSSVVETGAAQSDWADARHMWGIVLGGTARALRQGIPRHSRPYPGRYAQDGSISDPLTQAAPTSSAVLTVPAGEWERAAAARGGTANSLFVHLIANMLWDSGFPGETLSASLPVDTRDEPRVDNDLAMTEVTVTRSDTPETLRDKARRAYEHRMTSPGGIPEELLQVIPDRWAHRLAAGAGERDILCSNIGTLPASLLALGPHRCTGVAARAIHPGLTRARLPRTRLSGYLTRIAGGYTLALVGLDPDAISGGPALTALAESALADLGLHGLSW